MIKLVTDSTSCVPQDFAQKHDIQVVSLKTTIDDFVLVEKFEDSWDQFYENLKTSSNFPKTSQPAPSQFEDAFKNILNQDKDAKIIVVTISLALSGTYNSASIAANSVNPNQIFVVDSGQTAQSHLLLLEQAVEMINEGKTAEEIVNTLEELKKNACIMFVPQTLEYLKRGGRINLVSATIANVLNIKPILAFKNGVLKNTKKCLGMQKALSDLVAEVPKNFKKLYVCYVHEKNEFVKMLIDKLNKTFNLNITTAHKISPVVGSHIGIGAVGIAYLA